MLDPATLNAKGVRMREALEILRASITEPQMALEVAFTRAVFSNLMQALERDYGVFPGYFGSDGAQIEINPFDGVAMPPPVSLESPPIPVRGP